MARIPPYNFKQVLERSFKAAAEAIRVCIVNTTADPVPVTVVSGTGDTTPTIYNLTINSPNVEQSQALPTNCKRFMIKTRGQSELKIAYTATESGTNYITIKKGAVFTDDNLYASQTIYFQSPQSGDVVEIAAFV